jgi:hypothetical protein
MGTTEVMGADRLPGIENIYEGYVEQPIIHEK